MIFHGLAVSRRSSIYIIMERGKCEHSGVSLINPSNKLVVLSGIQDTFWRTSYTKRLVDVNGRLNSGEKYCEFPNRQVRGNSDKLRTPRSEFF